MWASKAINNLESYEESEVTMHEREFPNTTATGEHGTGHDPAASDTHANDGGAHAPENTHGGEDGHGQRHTEIDNSERTDVMKTTNKTTSTGAALAIALLLTLTCTGGAYGFTTSGGGGGGLEPSVLCDGGGGGYCARQTGGQLSVTSQGSRGGTLQGNVGGTSQVVDGVACGGAGTCDDKNIPSPGGGFGAGGVREEGIGGTGLQGPTGGVGGSGGGKGEPGPSEGFGGGGGGRGGLDGGGF